MRGASLPEKGQDLRRRKNGRPICHASLKVVIVAAAAAAVAAAIAAIAAVVVAAALVALAAPHHRARALLVLVDPDRHVADDVLVDLGLALQFGNDRRRRLEIERDIMSLAVLGDPVGDVAQAPGLGLDDLPAIVLDDLGGVFRQRVHLGLGEVLTRQKDMLVERHAALFLLLADR